MEISFSYFVFESSYKVISTGASHAQQKTTKNFFASLIYIDLCSVIFRGFSRLGNLTDKPDLAKIKCNFWKIITI